MQLEDLVRIIKLFKIKGDPFVIIKGINVMVMNEEMSALYHYTCPTLDPNTRYACKYSDLCTGSNLYSDYIWNSLYLIASDIVNYTNFQDAYAAVQLQMESILRELKSSDNATFIEFMDYDNNIRTIIPIFYNMAPLATGDTIKVYTKLSMATSRNIIIRIDVHKKKANIDFSIYRSFLSNI